MSVQADMPSESNGNGNDHYRGKHLHNAASISCDSATSVEAATQLPRRCHEAPVTSPEPAPDRYVEGQIRGATRRPDPTLNEVIGRRVSQPADKVRRNGRAARMFERRAMAAAIDVYGACFSGDA
jgi:hypothetical protein